VDTICSELRSALMSRIRRKDTGIELRVRKGLHQLGFRYRLGGAGLPGSPDIVLPKHRTVIFVHGCFWHGHDCSLFRLPKTRTEFWRSKIDTNRSRDRRTSGELASAGWNVLTLWECEIRNRTDAEVDGVVLRLAGDIERGNASSE